ncbi:hypothetical protein PQX77_010343 [Marasmius sp. AFHP31]|nr:hypothetical protein PQX77_010343 [Marasmius sp. AFHP31]
MVPIAAFATPMNADAVEQQYKFGILLPITVSVVHLFLYGINLLLFRIGLQVLKRRERQEDREGNRLCRPLLISLFVLSTVSVPISLTEDILDVRRAFCAASGLEYTLEVYIIGNVLQICRFGIVLAMGLIVDSILVFRCYLICGWQSRSSAITLVIACYISDTTAAVSAIWVLGEMWSSFNIHSPTDSNISNLLTHALRVRVLKALAVGCLLLHVLINAFLTIVIARKILWPGYRQSLALTTPKRFRTIAAILLQSCLFYLTGWLALITCILADFPNSTDLNSIVVQIAGIAPSLLIVRTNIRRDETETKDTMTTFHVRPVSIARSQLEVRSTEENTVLNIDGHSDDPGALPSDHHHA